MHILTLPLRVYLLEPHLNRKIFKIPAVVVAGFFNTFQEIGRGWQLSSGGADQLNVENQFNKCGFCWARMSNDPLSHHHTLSLCFLSLCCCIYTLYVLRWIRKHLLFFVYREAICTVAWAECWWLCLLPLQIFCVGFHFFVVVVVLFVLSIPPSFDDIPLLFSIRIIFDVHWNDAFDTYYNLMDSGQDHTHLLFLVKHQQKVTHCDSRGIGKSNKPP